MKKCFAAFAFLLVAFQSGVQATSSQGETSWVFTQAPFDARRHGVRPGRSLLEGAAAEGSRIVLLAGRGAPAVLTPEFAAAADPSVSFDGTRILFAGKRTAQDKWDIWEMDRNGGNKRQITRELGNCREPEYLALSSITPPDFDDKVRWITFISDAAGSRQEGKTDLATSLYVTNLEPIRGRNSVVWRTTFNLSSDFSPTVLQDGRVLFTSRQKYKDSPEKFPLLAANWDGTGLNLFCGTGQGARFKTMACEMPDRTLVFVESDNPSDAGGRLARVSYRRPLHSYELLSRGIGQYLYPHQSPDGTLVVSFSTGKESYGIYSFDVAKGLPGKPVFHDPKWESLDAHAVAQQPEPQGLISAVVDSLAWGHLHCMSVYESDIPEIKAIRKGAVTRVRFVEGVPVEPDGSFFVEVPADTPFLMQLLDDKGNVLGAMPRWMWVRRGTSRGCIGCHENKELAPENRASDAVRKGAPFVLRQKR
jgi:Hydrazine synthase alpha subunit middle domain